MELTIVSGDRFECNRTECLDVFGAARVRSSDGLPTLHTADAITDFADLFVHVGARETLSEIPHLDECRFTSTPLDLHLDATGLWAFGFRHALVRIVRVGNQLHESILNIPDCAARVLLEPPLGNLDFASNRVLCSHYPPF